MNVPLAILLAVFVRIAFRQIGGLRLGIWQIMLSSARRSFSWGEFLHQMPSMQ